MDITSRVVNTPSYSTNYAGKFLSFVLKRANTELSLDCDDDLRDESPPSVMPNLGNKPVNLIQENLFSKLDSGTPTSMAPTPAETSKANDNPRKRQLSTDSAQSTSSIEIVSEKKARTSAATTSVEDGSVTPAAGPLEIEEATAVPSFDYLKSLLKKLDDLPKMKKRNQSEGKTTENQHDMLTAPSDVMIASITSAEGASAPLVSNSNEG